MTAKQLMLPAHRAFDSDGAPEAGATAHLYQSGTLTPALFYEDAGLTVSLGSTITANAAGRFDPMPYQDASIAFRIIIEDSEGNVLDDIDPFYFGLVAGVDGVHADAANRSSLAAIAATNGDARYLKESGREGTFVFSTANLSALVTADTAQGIYVAPSSDTTGASGAWVRKTDGSYINPNWWGLVQGDSSANGATNTAAFSSMLATLTARRAANASSSALAIEKIAIPYGIYWFADNGAGVGIDITSSVVIEGHVSANQNSAPQLKFPVGVGGIRVQNEQSSGALTKDASPHNGAQGTYLRNLQLQGGFVAGMSESETHGIIARTTIHCENVSVRAFEGDGFYISASTGAASGANPPYGNANDCSFIKCMGSGNRNGIRFRGSDANACVIIGFHGQSNRQCGIYDSSFLGNTYSGGDLLNNGTATAVDGVIIPACTVSQGGNWYGVIVGQEAGASTNAPSGTATDNTWWYYISAGAPGSGVPAWFSGISVRAGGPVIDDSINSRNQFTGCYVENGGPKCQIFQRSLVIGGFMSQWMYQSATSTNACGIVYGSNGNVVIDGALQVQSGSVNINLGTGGGNTTNRMFSASHPTMAPSGFRLKFNSNDLRLDYADLDADQAFIVTGPSTAFQFGSGAAVPFAFAPGQLIIPDASGQPSANGRRITMETASPTTGVRAKGDFVLNRNPASATDAFGWRCRVAGTSGTWDPLFALASAPANIATSGSGADLTASSVTYAKIQNVTANRLLGNPTGSPASPAEITLGSSLAFSGTALQRAALTGDVTAAQDSNATTIANGAVSYAKMQNVTASRLLGNPTGSGAAPSEISLGSGLAFSGTTIDAPGKMLDQSSVASSVTGTTIKTTLATIAVPAGLMGNNGQLEIEAIFSVTNNANAKTVTIELNGNSLGSGANLLSTTGGKIRVICGNRNSASSQFNTREMLNSAATASFVTNTTAVATGSAQNITITATLSSAADTATLECYRVFITSKA